jgi:hypothetical protein
VNRDRAGYQAYMVRLWRVEGDHETWRFLVEDAHTGQRWSFADLAALCAFMQEKTGMADAKLKPPSLPSRV